MQQAMQHQFAAAQQNQARKAEVEQGMAAEDRQVRDTIAPMMSLGVAVVFLAVLVAAGSTAPLWLSALVAGFLSLPFGALAMVFWRSVPALIAIAGAALACAFFAYTLI